MAAPCRPEAGAAPSGHRDSGALYFQGVAYLPPPVFKIIDPRALQFSDVRQWIPALDAEDKTGGGMNLKLYKGDHWQDGAMWSGEMPEDTDDPKVKREAKKRLEKSHTSQNVVREVTDRHKAGVAGLDPITRYAPQGGAEQTTEGNTPGADQGDTEADKAALAANRAVSRWLERQNIRGLLQKVIEYLLLMDDAEAGLRLWLPPVKLARAAGLTNEQIGALGTDADTVGAIPLPEGLTLTEARDLMHLDVVAPGDGGVYTDPLTQDRFGVYFYEADGQQYAEISYLAKPTNADGTTQTTGDTSTYIGTVRHDGARTDSVPFDLQGALTIKTVKRTGGAMITPQIRQLQALLNKALTGMNLNLDWAGFLERIFLNGQMPAEEVDDPQKPGETKLKPKKYKAGHGTAVFIAGHEIEDEEGNVTGVTQPQVVIREPGKPDVYVDTAEAARYAILNEVNQLHALISGDAAPSGESRIQALADYIISLLLTAPAVNELGLWLVETVLLFAYALMGEAAPLQTGEEAEDAEAALRASFSVRIDPGPISPDMIRAVIERVKAGLLSRPTALAILGERDVDGELGLIEQQATLDRVAKRAETVKAFTDAGMSLPAALKEAGYSDDEIADMIAVETNPPQQ